MKYTTDRREYADPEKAAHKLLEIANKPARAFRTGASILKNSTGRFKLMNKQRCWRMVWHTR